LQTVSPQKRFAKSFYKSSDYDDVKNMNRVSADRKFSRNARLGLTNPSAFPADLSIRRERSGGIFDLPSVVYQVQELRSRMIFNR